MSNNTHRCPCLTTLPRNLLMLTSHQIQTINGIVDGVENEDEVEQLALSERKRQRAESIADAAHTVLNILRDDMADADRAAYDSLYAALSASAQEPGATRHLDAARAMWRWTLVRLHIPGPSPLLIFSAVGPVQSPFHPPSRVLAVDTAVVAYATTASANHCPLPKCTSRMEPLAMACKIHTCVELDACAVVVSCEYTVPLSLPAVFGVLR